MVVLKESICSLKEEVAELRNALEEMKKELSNTKVVEDNLLSSDGTWKTVRRGEGEGRGGEDKEKDARGEGSKGGKKRGKRVRVGGGGSGVRVEVQEGTGRVMGVMGGLWQSLAVLGSIQDTHSAKKPMLKECVECEAH